MIVDIDRTRLSWATVSEWCAIMLDEGAKLRPSSEHYRRLGDLYRSLDRGRIRASRDRAGLDQAARIFDLGRFSPIPSFHGLAAVLTRAEMGATLVELRNRHRALLTGRADRPRIKGPRLDPAMLTDEAIDRLIQAHPDLNLVERLRDERRARRLPALTTSRK